VRTSMNMVGLENVARNTTTGEQAAACGMHVRVDECCASARARVCVCDV